MLTSPRPARNLEGAFSKFLAISEQVIHSHNELVLAYHWSRKLLALNWYLIASIWKWFWNTSRPKGHLATLIFKIPPESSWLLLLTQHFLSPTFALLPYFLCAENYKHWNWLFAIVKITLIITPSPPQALDKLPFAGSLPQTASYEIPA